MGLYLCIFNEDEELEGVEVGSYADYNNLRNYVVDQLEAGNPGSRFPIFVLHSDCDGEWPVKDCCDLCREFDEIARELRTRPPFSFPSDWQKKVIQLTGVTPQSAFESFIDVDGEYLIERLKNLVLAAIKYRLPILFQ